MANELRSGAPPAAVQELHKATTSADLPTWRRRCHACGQVMGLNHLDTCPALHSKPGEPRYHDGRPPDFRQKPPYPPKPFRRFDFRPRPPYPRRPESNRRKPPMTAAVGMVCEDGVVLATDSMFKVGDNVTYGDKIYPLLQRPWLAGAVAGAGAVGFIKSVKEKIDDALPPRAVPITAVKASIDAANKEFYERHVLTHPNPEWRPYYGLLIAVSSPSSGHALLHTDQNSCIEVQGIELEGTGGVTAEPYKGLWRKDIPAFEAELAAIFMVKYAKIYDAQNCGGNTKVFCLYAHSLFELDQAYIKSAEDYFEHFSNSSLGLLLPADIDAELDEQFFTGGIRGLHEDLRHRRTEFRRWHRSAYKLVG